MVLTFTSSWILEVSRVGRYFLLISLDQSVIKPGILLFFYSFEYFISFKLKVIGDGKGTAKAFLDRIIDLEAEAQRSLMHRYTL